jgi:gliding motility-associated-like protein
MKSTLFILCFFYAFLNGKAQLIDLCGVWRAEGYGCYYMEAGYATFYYPSQYIYIEHYDTYTIATKIVGDGCVTSGNITWEGYFISNPFRVMAKAGNPLEPNSQLVNGFITVIDSETIELFPWGVIYFKMDCKEIDKAGLMLDSLDLYCKPLIVNGTDFANVFTPNADGVNDIFIPIDFNSFQRVSFQVFNRWGNRVFESKPSLYGWDGRIVGHEAPEGVYFWVVKYIDTLCNERVLKGHVTIFR